LRSTRVTKSKLGRKRNVAIPSNVATRRTNALVIRTKLPSLPPAVSIPPASALRGIDILEFLEIVPKEEYTPIGFHPLEQPRPRTAERKFVVPQFSSPKKSPEKKLSRYDKAAEAVKARSATRETMLFSRRS
jgi:hypothetical protein